MEDSFDIQGENIDDFSPIRRNPVDQPLRERKKEIVNWPEFQTEEQNLACLNDRDMIETERMIG